MNAALGPDAVALAHHWLVGMRGGEQVLEELCALFPGSPIYTLVKREERLSEELRSHPIHASPLGRLPGAAAHYKKLLPLFPDALRRFLVGGKPRLLLSSDASVIKGLCYDPDIPHVCYCHSPPRYLWGMAETYMRHSSGVGALARAVFELASPRVRQFDFESAQRVTYFIANSRFVAERIKTHYGRESVVIHPPVSVEKFGARRAPEDFYLVVSELVPYKRVDLAVDAFNSLGRRLVIIGGGSEMVSLQARARSNVVFMGRQPFNVLKDHYERCKALIFPGVEDFGITPLEAQAAGRPVIAFGVGGALETVTEGETGLFFHEQSAKALGEAVLEFEGRRFDPTACRRNAESFNPGRFRREIIEFLRSRSLI